MFTPTSHQFAEIWQTAVLNYERIAGKTLGDLDLKGLRTVSDLERKLQDQSESMDQFRAKRAKLFKVMRNAMLPVELIGQLAGGDVSVAFPPSSFVFGAVSYLITAAKNVSSAYDTIEDLMGLLADFTVRLQIYDRQNLSPQLRMKLAEVLATLLEIFALARRLIKRGRTIGYLHNLTLGADKEIQKSIDKLSRLTQSEDRLVGAEVHNEVTKHGKALDGISTTLSSTHLEVLQSRTETRQMKEEIVMLLKDSRAAVQEDELGNRDGIKAVLQPSVTPQDTYDKIKKERLSGSGDWIRDESLFKSWINKTIPVLWISGMPGAGKSFLSSVMISYLKEQFPSGVHNGAQVSVGYFFFKDNNPKMRSFHQALRDLAFQIYQNDPAYAKYLETVCGSFSDIETLESAWRTLFREYFVHDDATESTIFLVLDGLDEAYDPNEFLHLLQDLTTNEPSESRIQLVMVGRPHLFDAISDALQNGVVPTIDVNAAKNSEDIRNYIQVSIRKSRVLRRVSKKLQEEVSKSLFQGAHGMFLWVDLMMRELNGKSRESVIREALIKAPKGLTEMIQHVLEGLSESLSREDAKEDAEDLNEILAWVTCAKRPLTLGELDAILRYKSPSGDALLLLESKLRRQYASFFTLDREDGLSTADLQNISKISGPDDGDNDLISDDEEVPGFEDFEVDFDSNPSTTRVTFCHASIGDFFRDKNQSMVRSGAGPAIGVDTRSASASTLILVLKLCVDEVFEQKVSEGELFKNYAAENWLGHLRDIDISEISEEDKKIIGPLLVKFCRDEAVVERWTRFQGYDFWTGEHMPVLRSWIENEFILSALPLPDRDWVRSTVDAPVSAFAAVARINARYWLQHTIWSPPVAFWSVYGYRQHVDRVPLRDQSDGVESAQVIEDTAEWAGFTKTALWHRRVAHALRELSYLDEAESHFKISLELDPTLWRVRSGLGKVYACRKDYTQALQLCQQEVQVLRENSEQEPQNFKAELAAGLKTIGDYHSRLDKPNEAYRAYREAWDANPMLYDALAECFNHWDGEHNSQKIMDLVKEMASRDISDHRSLYLISYLVARKHDNEDIFFYASRRAARDLGELPYLVQIIQDAIRTCRDERRAISAVTFELFLADIYSIERVNPERAIRIWERIVSTDSSSKTESLMRDARHNASAMLAQFHLSRARATKGTLECNQHVQSLERLSKLKGRSGELVRLSWPSILLGLWYRLNGESDKAFTCLQVHIKHGLEYLSDDDPSNDLAGYVTLVGVLTYTGDDQRALGLWRKIILCMWQLSHGRSGIDLNDDDKESSKTDDGSADESVGKSESTVQESGKSLESPDDRGSNRQNDTDRVLDRKIIEDEYDDDYLFGLHCDGVCSHTKAFRAADNYWFCRFCYDAGFCDDCLALIKEDQLPFNVCSPDHEWLCIPLNVRYIPDDKIFVSGEGNEVIDIGEWKRDLGKAWGL